MNDHLETSRGISDNSNFRELHMNASSNSSASDEEEIFTCADAIEVCGFGQFQIGLSVFAGLLWMVDAMEIMVLAILAPTVRCTLHLTTWQESLIGTTVFAGMAIGAGMWGKFMDMYGRKKGILVFCVFVAVASLASAFAPNYVSLVVLRTIVGFGISGGAQAVTFYLEFLPAKSRAYCLVFLELFFCCGTFLEVLLAMLLMGHFQLSWHWLLGFSAVPMFIDLLAFVLVPESAHYHMACNEPEKAMEVLKRVARVNGKVLPKGRLVSQSEKAIIQINAKRATVLEYDKEHLSLNTSENTEECEDPIMAETKYLIKPHSQESNFNTKLSGLGHVAELFSTRLRGMTTLLLWIIWFGAAFGYYGVVLLTTEMLTIIQQYDKNDSELVPCIGSSISTSNSSNSTCRLLTTSDYKQLLWTTAAEFPGVILTVLIIERIGRKRTMIVEFLLALSCFFLMYICPIHKYILFLFIFGARGALTGAFQTAIVYTPEFYPTHIRALGTGICNSLSRVGAMVTPFIAEVLLRASTRGGEGTYAAACLICTLCALLLPVETRGRELDDASTQKLSVKSKSKTGVES